MYIVSIFSHNFSLHKLTCTHVFNCQDGKLLNTNRRTHTNTKDGGVFGLKVYTCGKWRGFWLKGKRSFGKKNFFFLLQGKEIWRGNQN